MNQPSLGELVERQLEVASLSGELQSVMEGIVGHLLELPDADGATLSTLEDGVAHFQVSLGADAPLQGRRMRLEDTLGTTCARTREVQVLRGASGSDMSGSLTEEAGAIVLAPIVYDGALRGILGVRSRLLDAFGEPEVERTRLLAQAAAIALRNAELVERLAASERQYRVLHAQAADATLVADLEGNIIDANEAAAALLLYTVEELCSMHSSALHDPAELAATPPRQDVLRELRELRSERLFRRKDGALIDVEYSSRVLDDQRVHTTLRDVTQRKLEDGRLRTSLGRLAAIIETQKEISALELDPVAVTTLIVERAQRLAGADGATVQWFDGDASVFGVGSGLAEHHAGLRLPRATSLAGLAASRQETVYSADTSTDPRVDPGACRLLGADSMICAPLYRDGEVEGVLSIFGREPEAFDELDVETTRLMAEFVSTVIRNSAELETRRTLVEELRTQGHVVQESEARFRGAFHAASVGMALTGLDGRFEQINARLAEMLGYTVEELSCLGVREITHPDDFAVDMARADELRSGVIESYQREKRYLRKDGSIVWGDLTVSVVRAAGEDEPSRVVSHVQDITDRKESALLFAAIFDDSVVPKLIADDERRLVDINDAAAELLGIPREQALGLLLDDLLPDEPIARLWSRFIEQGTMDAEVTLRRPGDGAERSIEFVATAHIRPGRHISVVRDLSHQKALEEQLRQAGKMEAVGRLAGGIAHDFNNLLTAISGYSEFLIADLHDERQLRHADEIRKAAARAASLTGQLLAFSRRQVLQPRVLDLNAVVSDMEMMLRRLIGEDVELVAILEPELGPVLADPTQIEQVIVNLVVNARDAMPHGGSLTIQTANIETKAGPGVELRMTDTGIGMSDEERSQLFDPFFTTKVGGTGLGLATVYGVVEQSGGTIEVDTSPGMGAAFRISFPQASSPVSPPEPARTPSVPERGDETILLVEDEAVVRQLVAEILETTGYAVLQASDGPSALELLRRDSYPIDLLLTDVVMPGMSGPEVAHAVTTMRPGTHVLYMSGYTDSAIGHHGVLEPGIAFLQKPFSAQDLTSKVRVLLDQTAQAVGV
jgi:two-component system cell cycle sensor histidine kinase/response regulator CckA